MGLLGDIEIMSHRGKWPRRLLRLWQRWEAVGWAFTYHHSDDIGTSEWEFELPSWPWRWVCWLQGHRPYDASIPKDNYCIICRSQM